MKSCLRDGPLHFRPRRLKGDKGDEARNDMGTSVVSEAFSFIQDPLISKKPLRLSCRFVMASLIYSEFGLFY